MPLHRTPVPLTNWFLAIWLIVASSKGISGNKLAEWLEVDYRMAWYVGHCICRLLTNPNWRKLSGVVEADETYVGGRKTPENDDPRSVSGGSKRGRGHGQVVVLVAAERGGDVRARRIATHSYIGVGNALPGLVDPSARLITDGLPAYRRARRTMAEHVTVDHRRRRFSNDPGDHVYRAESFIGLFRRAIYGIWHWGSQKHLDDCPTECTWRHNRRDLVVKTYFTEALGGLDAGPLGYQELVACG